MERGAHTGRPSLKKGLHMKRVVRRLVAALAVVATCLTGTVATQAPPAQAAFIESMGKYGQFDRFTWYGTVYSSKAVYIFDRTGGGMASAGLVDFINAWNYEISVQQLWGHLPVLYHFVDSGYVGNCVQGFVNGPNGLYAQNYTQYPGVEHSILVACAGEPTGNIGLAAGSGQSIRHIRQNKIFPAAWCTNLASRGLDQRMMLSCWAHEIGHLMGFAHNNTQGHIMNTNASGVYGKAWFTQDDINALSNLYPASYYD